MNKLFCKIAVLLAGILLFSLTAGAQQEKDWAKLGRYAQANAELKVYPFVVLYGDSITDNWGKWEKAWMEEHNFAGRGISGQTTSEMLVRFRQDVIELKPEYVALLCGTNDIARNNGFITVENTFKNIISMVELAKYNGIKPILCTVLPASEFGWRKSLGDPRPEIAKLNALITDYAKANQLPLVDYHSIMKDEQDALLPQYQKDAVHPNVEGYKAMEKAFLQVLDAACPLCK